MQELRGKEELANHFIDTRVAHNPKFRGIKKEKEINRTINDNRHEDGAKAPRESDGRHRAEVCHLEEVDPLDHANHLGLHIREQGRDGLQRAAASTSRGNAAEGREHHHLRLHLLEQGRDEPEPVCVERQADVNALELVGGMRGERNVPVARINGGKGERNREPESECEQEIYECKEPNQTVTLLTAAGIAHNGRPYFTICCTKLVECELRQLFSRGGVSGSSPHFGMRVYMRGHVHASAPVIFCGSSRLCFL